MLSCCMLVMVTQRMHVHETRESWVVVRLSEFYWWWLCRQRAVTEQNSLKNMLLQSQFRYVSSVSMQWVLFGSGGHKEMPQEGQLKGFDKCTGVLSKQMKCLGSTFWFHPHATFRPTHVHQCNFRCEHRPNFASTQSFPCIRTAAVALGDTYDAMQCPDMKI
jgi:hypothetical protein